MDGNNDKTKSVRCVRDIREFPPESYRLPNDGRKWMALCKERRAIANHLATYANGDGTSITAGINRWIREIGIKRRTLFRRLNDLRRLGLLRDKHGLTGESGTALRSLDVSKLKMPDEQGPGVPDSASGVPDSTDQKCQIEQAGVPDSTAEVPDSRSRVPIPPVFGTQPSFLPSTNRPSNRTADTVAVVKNLIGRLISIHMDAGKGMLSRAGSKHVLALPERNGVDQETIERVYRYWLTHRQLEGLQHPLIKFVEEFPENLEALQAEEKREANHVANVRKIAESQAAHDKWKECLEELTSRPSINYWERGSDEWVEEVKNWLRLNPQPAQLMESNGELRPIVDSSTYGWCILQGQRAFADAHVSD